MPFGGGGGKALVLLKETGSPLKQTEFSSKTPPNALQKSDFDCQRSVNLERVAFLASSALLCNAGAKGEFKMDTSWQDSHTVEQKLSFDWLDEDDTAVELHRIGTDRRSELMLNSFAENGSQVWNNFLLSYFFVLHDRDIVTDNFFK